MNLSPESDSDAIDGLRHDLLTIIEKQGTPREYAPRTTRQLNALISLISERDALRESLRWLESLSEDGPVSIGTVTDEEVCIYRVAASWTCASADSLVGAIDSHQKAHKRRRAHAAYHNTQPDQGGKAE